jgi:hypothetical protein
MAPAKGKSDEAQGALMEMILKSLQQAGGEEYLVEQAKGNPSAFLTLIGKVLPLQASAGTDDAIEARVAGAREILAAKLDRIAQARGEGGAAVPLDQL